MAPISRYQEWSSPVLLVRLVLISTFLYMMMVDFVEVAIIACHCFGDLILRYCVSLLVSTIFLLVTWSFAAIAHRYSLSLVVVIVSVIVSDRFVEANWLWMGTIDVQHGNGGCHCDGNY